MKACLDEEAKARRESGVLFLFEKRLAFAVRMWYNREERGDTVEYRIVRTARRTLALEIEKTGNIVVRAPYAAPLSDIERFVQDHADWIAHHQRLREARTLPPLTAEEEARLRTRAREVLPALTAHWAQIMGVTYTGVTITSARHRFGSCNSRGRIAYSFRLMQFPDEVIEYVVVHELAHRKEMNHSARFYAIIATYIPDYKRRVALLKTHPRAL